MTVTRPTLFLINNDRWKLSLDEPDETTEVTVEFNGGEHTSVFRVSSTDLAEYGFTSIDAQVLFNNEEAVVVE